MKASIIRILLGVVIAIVVIVGGCVLLFKCTANTGEAYRTASSSVSILKPVISILYDITGNASLYRLKRDMEEQEFAIKREKEEIGKAEELERVKKELDEFMKNTSDPDYLMAIRQCGQEYQHACSSYTEAKRAIDACNSGRAHITLPVVSEAVNRIKDVKTKVTAMAEQVKKKRVYLSTGDRIKENTERLAFTLNQSGMGYRINLDSFGLNRNDKGDLRILVMNGHLCYKPDDSWRKAEENLKAFGFTPNKTPDCNLEIVLLKNNDRSGPRLWGKAKDFDLKALKRACSLRAEYNQYRGVYASISFSFYNASYRIPCNRLTWAVNNSEHCDVIIVDLRPQEWIRWSLSYPVTELNLKGIVEEKGRLTVSQPSITTCYGRANLQFKHLPIEHRINRTVYGNVSVDGKVTDVLNRSVEDLMFRKASGKDAGPDADDELIVKGLKYAEDSQWKKAFSCFEQSAASGNKAGAYWCGILIARYSWMVLERSQRRNTFALAEQYLLTATQSKNVQVRSDANCAVAALYERGGFGVAGNLDKAEKFYREAAKDGNKNAIQRLQFLEKVKALRRLR